MAKQTQTTGQARTPEPPVTFNRTERAVAFMVGGIFAAIIICFVAMIIAWLTIHHIPGTGVWPIVLVVPLVGAPIGMLLMFALIIMTGIRRSRESRGGTR